MSKFSIEKAITICQSWFDYLDNQRNKAKRMQELAHMSKNGHQKEAQRLRQQMDNHPTVYDGARLEPAVKFLIDENKKLQQRNAELERHNLNLAAHVNREKAKALIHAKKSLVLRNDGDDSYQKAVDDVVAQVDHHLDVLANQYKDGE